MSRLSRRMQRLEDAAQSAASETKIVVTLIVVLSHAQARAMAEYHASHPQTTPKPRGRITLELGPPTTAGEFLAARGVEVAPPSAEELAYYGISEEPNHEETRL